MQFSQPPARSAIDNARRSARIAASGGVHPSEKSSPSLWKEFTMSRLSANRFRYVSGLVLAASVAAVALQAFPACQEVAQVNSLPAAQAGRIAGGPRERILIDADWRFIKGDPEGNTTNLLYAPRQQGRGRGGRGGAASQPAEGAAQAPQPQGIANWVLPSANALI
jgi:hypothetical protein